MSSTLEMAQLAKAASIPLAAVDGETKNRALAAVAEALAAATTQIVGANEADVARSEAEQLAAPLLKRLAFGEKKIADTVAGIESLIRLPEPVGVRQVATELDEGLELYRETCPIGVIGIIFESRPDALVQISTLCLKSGNAVLLKGGSEAIETNRVLARIVHDAAVSAGAPKGWLQLLETRDDVADMLSLDHLIDLIVPRGSNEFVQHIMNNSNIPVLGHADGICHVYLDRSCDEEMAVRIVVDSKAQYVAVCNACETLLVDAAVAESLLPKVADGLLAAGVTLKGCARTQALISCEAADESDWATEYLDYSLSIRVVDGLDAAIAHINQYGSGHTDVIVTADEARARRFMQLVDSGNVFWNCSSRFSDGFRYGLGAEVGISTNKIHARGPVGLDGLLIYKWKLFGHGQIVKPYADGTCAFTHKPIA
jgi:glutamate-5-semialdehyde dehydrogenase